MGDGGHGIYSGDMEKKAFIYELLSPLHLLIGDGVSSILSQDLELTIFSLGFHRNY